MGITVGTRIGIYQVAELLGKGGMGEVYRARDTRLDRDVAIKTLPEEFARNSERLSRFEREARLLASLNHPNIGAIYGLEEFDGARLLILELVEGETLADVLKHGAISLDESLKLAIQISEALEAAHEKGVVHRDLKPANIKVTSEGKVKVLDFGLAKALATDDVNTNLSNSPTLSVAATQQGLILGTAAYMSPEQARGHNVDKRTDIWALGAILYEMLTGKQAFQGEDIGDILATVVKTEPDWSSLPNITPTSIRTLLQRCLRKDRRQRLGDAGTVRIELQEALASPPTGDSSRVESRRVSLVGAVLVGIIAAAAALAVGTSLRTPPTQQALPGVVRLSLSLPPGTETSERPASVVISADGTQVAFIGTRNGIDQLYLRRMEDHEARLLKDTNAATYPFFSPDGKWLGFIADGKLKKLSTSSGIVEVLADGASTGASWGDKDTIVFAGRNKIFTIPSTGGTPRSIEPLDQDQSRALYHSPEFLPGGEAVLFTTATADVSTADERSIEVLRVSTGERKTLIRGYNPHYVPTGHLIYLNSRAVMAVPFDVDRLEITGVPVAMIEGLRETFAGGVFTCSGGGHCVYVGGGTVNQRTVAMVDRAGVRQTLQLTPQNYTQPRFSPTGDKIAFWIEQSRCDVVVYDTARNQLTRLTSEGDNHFPIWTPTGQEVTFSSRRVSDAGYEFISKAIDGSGREHRLTETALSLAAVTSLSWSPDGSVLAYVRRGDIWLLPMAGNRETRPFFESPFNETIPSFSPDGKWLAYASDETGEQQIYVRPFPGPGAQYPVSRSGGTEPVWARNGRELFFRNRDQMMVVQVDTQRAFNASPPRVLFVSPYASRTNRINYDVSPDGERFVMVDDGNNASTTNQINVALNWFTELLQRVPVK